MFFLRAAANEITGVEQRESSLETILRQAIIVQSQTGDTGNGDGAKSQSHRDLLHFFQQQQQQRQQQA